MTHALYKPTQADVTWARNAVYWLKDGGIWGCSWGVYRVNKTERKIELLKVNPEFPKEALGEMQHRTEVMFNAIGYSVTMKGEHYAEL